MSAPTGTELLLPVAVSVGHGALGFPGQLLPGALSFPTPVTPVCKGHRVAWHMVALEDRHHSSVSETPRLGPAQSARLQWEPCPWASLGHPSREHSRPVSLPFRGAVLASQPADQRCLLPHQTAPAGPDQPASPDTAARARCGWRWRGGC